MSKSNARMPKSKILLFIAAALLLAASVAVFYFCSSAEIGGKRYPLSADELDLSGNDIDDFSALGKFNNLEYVDLRNTGLTVSEYDALSQSLPECSILWSVPLGSSYFDSSTSSVSVDSASITTEQLDALRYMNNLTSLEIYGSVTDVTVGTKLNQLADELSGCNFVWNIELGGQAFPHDAESITLPASTAPDEYGRLLLFRNLTEADITSVEYSDSLASVINQISSGNFLWTVDLAGVEVLSSATEADISDHTVEDLDAFSAKLSTLPNLTYLEMCNCGLTNEQMEQLMTAHPSIKFVWTISFLRWENIRTDITCFSSLNHSTQLYDEEDLVPLFKYCTDLVALDLGHSSIVDISMISNLTKLQALILGDNNIKDISPLETLQELEYLELWKNDFTDVSVLTKLPDLKDVNLAYCNDIEDFSPLFNIPTLEMLWLQHSDFPEGLEEQLREKYPDCMFSFYKYDSAHGNGWCAQDRYLGIRKAFRNWRYVIRYTDWQNVEYQEGVDLLPAIKKWD